MDIYVIFEFYLRLGNSIFRQVDLPLLNRGLRKEGTKYRLSTQHFCHTKVFIPYRKGLFL
jgi:hypothetical protein